MENNGKVSAGYGLVEKKKYPYLPIEDLSTILGITIKEDNTNKVIAFLGELSAYTKSSQFNISFNAPSSTGKSYIPLEICTLFPEEDVLSIGYCSPTAFFHEIGEYDKERRITKLNLSRKILIFLDQPHTLLLQHLRPLLSHDQEEMTIKITDKDKSIGLRTKNIIIKGFPAVTFCSAGLKLDEQESTRFLLLSPESSQEKIRQAIIEKVAKESNRVAYEGYVEKNSQRQALKERILAIRNEQISDINIESQEKIIRIFLKKKILKARHMRDVGRVISLVKAIALLNLWHKKREGSVIFADEEDIIQARIIWRAISKSQEYNLPPYVYELYKNTIKSFFDNAQVGITRNDIIQKHYSIYSRALPDWELRRLILPLLESAGLIIQESDPEDRRTMLIYPNRDKNKVD